MISLILSIALVGLLVWAITTYVPMPSAIKNLIIVVAVVLLVFYVLQVLGVASLGPPLPRLR